MRKTPKNEKELKSCHDCGFEDFDGCENEKKHRSCMPTSSPCRFCVRNPESLGWYDFYDTNWTLSIHDGTSDPFIEDPDPHVVTLLKTLHQILQKEIDLTPVQEVRT